MRRLVLLVTLAGCQLSAGTTPDAAACAPSFDFFASDVWPRYLVANQCNDSQCHASHGTLRLTADLHASWLSAIQAVDCAAPLQSRLLTVPEGVGNRHPPGPVVRNRDEAAMLLDQWVSP